ncbi:M66 family metalloprotease [Nannocystis bainbridge]|uniref:M66 family metalloprotease n=1 Tax=Nannocystis bainbridge TaxID=2995303 RepID=A0ABT5DUD6_9BACT|nr:M66 family metalloprotease [Nannocystis bainbridge]MDC0717171.1 M66 family metalloprotease [Nannocystis bainbridge]
MTRPQLSISAALALALAPACGDDTGGAATGDGPATNITATDGPGGTSEGGSESDGGVTTAAPEPFVPVPAVGGIELEWVEANQGIGVAIGRDGAGVGGSDRTSYLLQNRLTLIRAFWRKLPEDWVPREIEARLIISGYPEGDKVLSSKALVDGAAFVGNLEKSFYWGLMPAEVISGLKYRIELWETEKGWAQIDPSTPAGSTPPNLPVSGNAFIGVEDSYQIMKVTIVPYNYNFGGCVTTPDLSESTMKKFETFMFMMNPIERLEITLHEPIDWQGELTHFGQLNQFMVDLRQQDGAPPETYYYGYVDVCSGGLGGAGGQAIDIPSGALKNDAWKRTSSGLSLPGNTDYAAETFVHEVGHSQGRYHIACSGEAGTDNSYPHQGGDIGEWGFGINNFKLYHPTVHKDYMTYCHPVWASTFGWNKVFPIIQQLSSWDTDAPPAPEQGDVVLLGVIQPDGTESWITTPGAVDPNNLSAVQHVEFFAGGESVAVQAAEVRPQPDSDAVNIVVALPEGFDDVTQIARVDGARRTITRAEDITISHKYRALPLSNK